MAYPFGKPIAYAAFIQRLCAQHGCSVRAAERRYVGSRGPEQFRYLHRDTNDGPRIAYLPEQDPTTDLMPSVVRSICAQLDVDNTAFGVLSDDDDDD